MKLKEIHRTSTFSFYPSSSDSKGDIWLTTGTVAGALDASFSNESLLEIWAPQLNNETEFEMGREPEAEGDSSVNVQGRLGKIVVPSRFNSIGWGSIDNAAYSKGIIAGGLDTGELILHDPAKLIAGETDSLIFSTNQHTSPLRALAFNTHSSSRSLLCTASTSSEIFIWNLASISSTMKPYSPGARSTKLDEVSCLGWNKSVPYVLASGSNSGYCVVWDLRGKREVVALSHSGSGAAGGAPGGAGRSGVSDVCWHPDNATRLLTSTDSDASPVISLWDLRNARAPEKTMTGHSKGILSMDWCTFDSGLLMSCGKDKRGICWNVSLPAGEEILGELPPSANWSYQIAFHPSQPSVLANASYDGTISLHTLQSISVEGSAPSTAPQKVEEDTGADIFDTPSLITTGEDRAGIQLTKHTPKWMQPSVGVRWGYGGKLVRVTNNKDGSKVILENVTTEEKVLNMAKELRSAADSSALKALLETKLAALEEGSDQQETYRALLRLFSADSRAELVKILGFEKGDVEARVREGVLKLKEREDGESKVVSFKEPAKAETEDEEEEETEVPEASAAALLQDSTPSEPGSGSGSVSVNTNTNKTAEADTEIDGASTHLTEPSLFGGEDIPPVAPGDDDAANFFSSMGPNLTTPLSGAARRLPHMNPAPDSSVAATAGSRRTSLSGVSDKADVGGGETTDADGVLPVRNVTFRMYPPAKAGGKAEPTVEQLLTRSLVIGDFSSAVELCISSSRWADAILLATRGPPSLLQRAQKAYFEQMTPSVPYLRLYQSIVGNDLGDIVQNCDLREWKEIFVVLSTFASADEFWSLCESLGERIEFAGRRGTLDSIGVEGWRKNAMLCYLASGKLEKVVGIWLEEMSEDETRLAGTAEGGARYTAHAQALQIFIEKITFFRGATKYVDLDLSASLSSTSVPAEDLETPYKLSALYDRYFEYADLLAAQGMVREGLEYVNLTPPRYKGAPGSKVVWEIARERLQVASGASAVPSASSGIGGMKKPSLPTTTAATGPGSMRQPAVGYPYDSYPNAMQIPTQPAAPAGPYGAPSYTAAKPVVATPYGAQQPTPAARPTPYGSYGGVPNGSVNPAPARGPGGGPYGQMPYSQPQSQGVVVPPPPPPFMSSSTDGAAPPSAPGVAPPPGPGAARPPVRKAEKVGGWNDAPVVPSRSPANVPPPNAPKRAPIVSPFPQSQSGPASPAPTMQGGFAAPPPRGGTPLSQQFGGPPRPSSAQNQPTMHPPPGRGPSFGTPPPPGSRPMGAGGPPPPPPTNAGFMPPPGRVVSPPQPQQGFAPPPPMGRVTSPPTGHPQMMRPPQDQMPPPPQMRGGPAPYGGTTPQASNAPLPPVSRGPTGPYAPPPNAAAAEPSHAAPPPPSISGQFAPPPPSGGPPGGPPRQAPGPGSQPHPPSKAAPPKPKYPAGDRTHIPDSSKPVFETLIGELDQLKQTTPPQQKRIVEDTERRLNLLFDALNCETLSPPVIGQLQNLTRAVSNRNRDEALAIHMNLLTTGSKTDDIGVWMSGIKQLLLRM